MAIAEKAEQFRAARGVLEGKCATHGCWHRSARGFLYCICCLYGRCQTIPTEARQMYLDAIEFVKEA